VGACHLDSVESLQGALDDRSLKNTSVRQLEEWQEGRKTRSVLFDSPGKKMIIRVPLREMKCSQISWQEGRLTAGAGS
jgi:hypothetical protein